MHRTQGDIDQSFSNNASHRGNNSQIRVGLVCETLHYLHQIPFSLHCRHNRHCRATYVAAWPTVQHEKQYKSSQNDLHLCLFAVNQISKRNAPIRCGLAINFCDFEVN